MASRQYYSDYSVDSDEEEMEEHTQKTLKELEDGKHRVHRTTGYGCPFCGKVANSAFNSVLAHADDSRKSYKKSAGYRARHMALALFLKNQSAKEKAKVVHHDGKPAKKKAEEGDGNGDDQPPKKTTKN